MSFVLFTIISLKKHLSIILSKLLQYEDSKTLDVNRNFFELGVDSLITIEFAQHIDKMFSNNFKTSTKLLFDYPNIEELSIYLLEQLEPSS